MVQSIRDVIPASGDINRQDFEDSLGLTEDKVDILYNAWLAEASNGFAGALRVREKLTAARTYYVNGTTGSDTNDGLTSGTAFATIQKAVDVALAIDFGIYNVTISVADGTYVEQIKVGGRHIGTGNLTIQGNTTTPSNAVIGDASIIYGFLIDGGAVLTIKGFQFNSQYAINTRNKSIVTVKDIVSNITTRTFYLLSGSVILCEHTNLEIRTSKNIVTSYGVSYCSLYNTTIPLIGTISWPSASPFYISSMSYCWLQLAAFTGTATGKRYTALKGSIIDTNGGGASFIPGDIAGSVDSSSYYL